MFLTDENWGEGLRNDGMGCQRGKGERNVRNVIFLDKTQSACHAWTVQRSDLDSGEQLLAANYGTFDANIFLLQPHRR